MKLLYITFEAPSSLSGGGIGIKQSILSLAKNYDINYVGPEITDEEIKSNVNSLIIIKHNSNFILRSLNLFKGITTGFYHSWLKEREKINWNKYEIVFLEFSRYDFIAKYIKLKGKKLVIRVHNVEHDYYSNIRKYKKSIQSILRYKYICKQEPSCLSYADYIICLTQRDKDRLLQLYPNSLLNSRIGIIPVCVKHPVIKKTNNELSMKNPYILITGSMWYGPNLEGIKWFINNVWSDLQFKTIVEKENYRLLLAGSKASEEIQMLVSKYDNIKLIDSPEDITPYFRNASIYVAPIFHGAGMKVKVAEALSFGLPIVGTEHAFIGYNIINGKNGYIANSAKQFMDSIEQYINMDNEKKNALKENIYKVYMENYSMDSSEKGFKDIISSMQINIKR